LSELDITDGHDLGRPSCRGLHLAVVNGLIQVNLDRNGDIRRIHTARAPLKHSIHLQEILVLNERPARSGKNLGGITSIVPLIIKVTRPSNLNGHIPHVRPNRLLALIDPRKRQPATSPMDLLNVPIRPQSHPRQQLRRHLLNIQLALAIIHLTINLRRVSHHIRRLLEISLNMRHPSIQTAPLLHILTHRTLIRPRRISRRVSNHQNLLTFKLLVFPERKLTPATTFLSHGFYAVTYGGSPVSTTRVH